MCLTTGCTNFVGADTDGTAAESGTSGAVAEGSTGDDPVATATTNVATTASLSTSSSTSTTNASDVTTTSSSTGSQAETTDASTTTGDSDPTTSDSTGTVASCENEAQDGDETDVDCGGSTCSACELGADCQVGTDCNTGFCPPSSMCSLQTPVVWLDALDADTLYNEVSCSDSPPTPGQQVYCWQNKGSHGGFFVDGGSQPIYREPLDGVEFDNQSMLSDDAVFGDDLDDVTVFLVQQEVTSRNSFDFNLNHPSDGGSRYSAHVPWGMSDRRVIFDIGGSGGGARISTALDVVAVDETHVFTFVNSMDDDERLIHIDGAEEAAAAGFRSADAGVVSIGNGNHAVVHEFRVYSPSPSAVQRQLIEGQLACRWDLRDELPATHPFYDVDGASETDCPPAL